MTTNKESAPVHITNIDQEVQNKAAEAMADRAWKKEIIVLIVAAVVSLPPTLGTVAVAVLQMKTRDAVVDGTNNTRNAVIQGTQLVQQQTQQVAEKLELKTKEVADRLETSTSGYERTLDEHGHKLDETLTTSKQNHALSNSLMLAMKKELAETARNLADRTMDPMHIAKAELAEKAYMAHKKTHDEMQAKEKRLMQ